MICPANFTQLFVILRFYALLGVELVMKVDSVHFLYIAFQQSDYSKAEVSSVFDKCTIDYLRIVLFKFIS